jgi:hypothetical protein
MMQSQGFPQVLLKSPRSGLVASPLFRSFGLVLIRHARLRLVPWQASTSKLAAHFLAPAFGSVFGCIIANVGFG